MAVLGAGKSGIAAAKLGHREGAFVSVRDNGARPLAAELQGALDNAGIELLRGDDALEGAEGFDLAVLSPGIEEHAPLVRAFTEKGVSLFGEIEFADRFNQKPVVAITGTNGKTTTTELVEKILAANGQKAVAAGNYGRAYSDVVLTGDYEVVALEVSSFQLEGVVDFRPGISVWLNFAPDHLDRHEDVADYRNAKLRIFGNQTADDYAVINHREDVGEIAPEIVTFSAFEEGGDFSMIGKEIMFRGEPVCDFGACRLRGTHNAENLMAAMAVGWLRGIPFPDMESAVLDHAVPPHRCELVATVDGCEYINDSKATNLHALEQSLRSQPEAVVLIAGGKDKGLGFEVLADLVAERTTHVVAIGEIRDALVEAWSGKASCEAAADLEDAVQMARQAASAGQTILFSPGTSSFDMFSGFEERGNAFRILTSTLQ